MVRYTAVALTAGLTFALSLAGRAGADSQPYIGDVVMVGFGYCPRDWVPLEGQMLPVAQNRALYEVIGTTYGGDGTATFGLPDMRGRVPVHMGTGIGTTPRDQGDKFGLQAVTLGKAHLTEHSHPAIGTVQSALLGTTAFADTGRAAGAVLAQLPDPPAPVIAAPLAGAVDPAVDAAEPVVDAVDPAVDAAEPLAGAVDPAPDAAEPVAGVVDPAPDAAEPVAGVVDPAPDAAEPVAGVVDPVASANEPLSPTPSPAPADPALTIPEPMLSSEPDKTVTPPAKAPNGTPAVTPRDGGDPDGVVDVPDGVLAESFDPADTELPGMSLSPTVPPQADVPDRAAETGDGKAPVPRAALADGDDTRLADADPVTATPPETPPAEAAAYRIDKAPDTQLADGAVTTSVSTSLAPVGASASFSVSQPSVAMRYCMAMYGAFPSRQ